MNNDPARINRNGTERRKTDPVKPGYYKNVKRTAGKPAGSHKQSHAAGAASVHQGRKAQAIRQKTIPEKRPAEQNNVFKKLIIFVVLLLIILLGIRIVLFFKDENALLIREVKVEAGDTRPDLNMFFSKEPAFPELVTCNLDFNEVDINIPQTISFNIGIYGINNACRLIITDTVPPSGEAVAQNIFASDDIPDASACIKGINDITSVSVTWKDVPDMSPGGSYTAVALLTDGCGNETLIDVPFEVTRDSTAPEIIGAADLETYVGDSAVYRKNIMVTDDYDEDPVLTIDTSDVDLSEEGTYEVTYTATDFSGNSSSVTIELTVMEKPEGYVEPDVVYEAARQILDEITEPGMTEEEVALQIVWWCRYNIRFILRTYSNSWTEAAYNAFIYRTGNCYSTAYAAKALFDVAGFENMIIERYPYQTATHFWNYVLINGQWYHCDSTWREGYDSYFFMYT